MTTYNAENGKLLTSIKYNSKDQLVCMYDDSIYIIENKENKEIINTSNSEITFMSVDLNDNIVDIEEESTGVFKTNSFVKITNTQSNHINTYNIEEVPKELYAKEDVIAVNVGTEIYFLNSSGRLIKSYSTRQEITNVVFSNNLAAILYKDKIIIVEL